MGTRRDAVLLCNGPSLAGDETCAACGKGGLCGKCACVGHRTLSVGDASPKSAAQTAVLFCARGLQCPAGGAWTDAGMMLPLM